MNCSTSNHSSDCFCGGFFGPHLWSKKKKLEVLEHYLECIEEKKQDIQEAIDELKKE